ncbi:hypothetical protein HHI36_001672 [Cryptolaemus montrouzieri]|uniref:Uncharacterized protein n=1 Tax=Cryptolaemus montrouzieri TaxID=559131 RepID=A0ABD2P9L5_9CUCU
MYIDEKMDILDIAIIKNMPWKYQMEVKMDLSDDCPMILKLKIQSDARTEKRHTTNKPKIKEDQTKENGRKQGTVRRDNKGPRKEGQRGGRRSNEGNNYEERK